MTDRHDSNPDWDEDDAERDLEAEFRELGFRSRDDSSDPDEPHDDETDKDESPPEFTTGERGVEVSMEIDEQGNEVWYAEDSEVPGSTSIGHSVEEAVEGVEDRRRIYREMRRRSREKRDPKKPEE